MSLPKVSIIIRHDKHHAEELVMYQPDAPHGDKVLNCALQVAPLVQAFKAAYYGSSSEYTSMIVGDMIADLMHYVTLLREDDTCELYEDAYTVVQSATRHFDEETHPSQ